MGVFKHHLFNKIDTFKFFACMKALKSFSLVDENRRLINVSTRKKLLSCQMVVLMLGLFA